MVLFLPDTITFDNFKQIRHFERRMKIMSNTLMIYKLKLFRLNQNNRIISTADLGNKF